MPPHHRKKNVSILASNKLPVLTILLYVYSAAALRSRYSERATLYSLLCCTHSLCVVVPSTAVLSIEDITLPLRTPLGYSSTSSVVRYTYMYHIYVYCCRVVHNKQHSNPSHTAGEVNTAVIFGLFFDLCVVCCVPNSVSFCYVSCPHTATRRRAYSPRVAATAVVLLLQFKFCCSYNAGTAVPGII